mmetsp:Transcript_105955/g.187622  ORF Transcript_105955/g.187622 Transcript_105955/m.187622 type:complete len:210 (+) Transcript_105955:211-840(+)
MRATLPLRMYSRSRWNTALGPLGPSRRRTQKISYAQPTLQAKHSAPRSANDAKRHAVLYYPMVVRKWRRLKHKQRPSAAVSTSRSTVRCRQMVLLRQSPVILRDWAIFTRSHNCSRLVGWNILPCQLPTVPLRSFTVTVSGSLDCSRWLQFPPFLAHRCLRVCPRGVFSSLVLRRSSPAPGSKRSSSRQCSFTLWARLLRLSRFCARRS